MAPSPFFKKPVDVLQNRSCRKCNLNRLFNFSSRVKRSTSNITFKLCFPQTFFVLLISSDTFYNSPIFMAEIFIQYQFHQHLHLLLHAPAQGLYPYCLYLKGNLQQLQVLHPSIFAFHPNIFLHIFTKLGFIQMPKICIQKPHQ